VKFLVDAQLPPMLAAWLRKAGHEAQHVQEINLRDADDLAIRAYASRNGAVVITKDRDFTPTGGTAIKVVWVRTGNVGTRALIDRVEAALPQLVGHLNDGADLVELR
jgi:predicted nuclease of predicted toxin-antitoxin system